jgi:hypothetical protein
MGMNTSNLEDARVLGVTLPRGRSKVSSIEITINTSCFTTIDWNCSLLKRMYSTMYFSQLDT